MFSDLIAMLIGIKIIKGIGKGNQNIDLDKNIDVDKNILDRGIEIAGYGYDSEQDIFYCSMDAWQRNMGYTRLYDEATAPLGMILDCEPIYFGYDGRRWLIELWKGQYDLNTGCEIGVYTTKESGLDIFDKYKYTFYDCVSNEDRLTMSFSLEKNGKTLFSRDEKHWWLSGFKLGEFSEPSELTMYLNITLKDRTMCEAFIGGLKNAGYSSDEISVNGNTVSLVFDKPHTAQPITRTSETDRIIQMKNKLLCDKYTDITKVFDNFTDKISEIKKQAPDIYEEIIEKAKLRNYLRSVKGFKII